MWKREAGCTMLAVREESCQCCRITTGIDSHKEVRREKVKFGYTEGCRYPCLSRCIDNHHLLGNLALPQTLLLDLASTRSPCVVCPPQQRQHPRHCHPPRIHLPVDPGHAASACCVWCVHCASFNSSRPRLRYCLLVWLLFIACVICVHLEDIGLCDHIYAACV